MPIEKDETGQPDRVAVHQHAPSWRLLSRAWIDAISSWLVSFLAHAVIVLTLALLMVTPQRTVGTRNILSVAIDNDEIDGESLAEISAGSAGGVDATVSEAIHIETTLDVPSPLANVDDRLAAPQNPDAAAVLTLVPEVDMTEALPGSQGGGLEGRTGGLKQGLLARRGGNAASEDAVARGLQWLARHQRPDGGWWFDHGDGPCDGRCRNPGDFASTTAATGLALLPFLGAGHTHQSGDYSQVVRRGLEHLKGRMVPTEHGGDLQEGSMYGHGLAAIALCEAYAMSRDEELREPAQAAIHFIVYAQHGGGGWRYFPGQPGDMTVSGWQVMALKSGQMAGLSVSRRAMYRVGDFLDSVQVKDGSRFGYQTREPHAATSAIGLLLRMYGGWQRGHDVLKRGVRYLDRLGPSKRDMYFNYYATQVLAHVEGRTWERWNKQLRDRLVAEQSRTRHEAGSWYYEHPHSKTGGRLFNTCMGLMTLEVYYRYLPLYGPGIGDDS